MKDNEVRVSLSGLVDKVFDLDRDIRIINPGDDLADDISDDFEFIYIDKRRNRNPVCFMIKFEGMLYDTGVLIEDGKRNI